MIDTLKNHHHKLRFLMEEMTDVSNNTTKGQRLIEELRNDLQIHRELHRMLFYPFAGERREGQRIPEEMDNAHKEIDLLINELEQTPPNSPIWNIIMLSIREQVEDLLEQEETKVYQMVLSKSPSLLQSSQEMPKSVQS